MYCLLYILKSGIFKQKPTPLPNDLIPEKSTQHMNKDIFNKLLNNINDFKLLTSEEIEHIKQLSDEEKLQIILTYNSVVEWVNVMLEDK
jgi:hypothetical protein